jgi:hypothetical protein
MMSKNVQSVIEAVEFCVKETRRCNSSCIGFKAAEARARGIIHLPLHERKEVLVRFPHCVQTSDTSSTGRDIRCGFERGPQADCGDQASECFCGFWMSV